MVSTVKKFVLKTGFEAPVKVSTSIRNVWRIHCYTKNIRFGTEEVFA